MVVLLGLAGWLLLSLLTAAILGAGCRADHLSALCRDEPVQRASDAPRSLEPREVAGAGFDR